MEGTVKLHEQIEALEAIIIKIRAIEGQYETLAKPPGERSDQDVSLFIIADSLMLARHSVGRCKNLIEMSGKRATQ
jgi:hypothetical protein